MCSKSRLVVLYQACIAWFPFSQRCAALLFSFLPARLCCNSRKRCRSTQARKTSDFCLFLRGVQCQSNNPRIPLSWWRGDLIEDRCVGLSVCLCCNANLHSCCSLCLKLSWSLVLIEATWCHAHLETEPTTIIGLHVCVCGENNNNADMETDEKKERVKTARLHHRFSPADSFFFLRKEFS